MKAMRVGSVTCILYIVEMKHVLLGRGQVIFRCLPRFELKHAQSTKHTLRPISMLILVMLIKACSASRQGAIDDRGLPRRGCDSVLKFCAYTNKVRVCSWCVKNRMLVEWFRARNRRCLLDGICRKRIPFMILAVGGRAIPSLRLPYTQHWKRGQHSRITDNT